MPNLKNKAVKKLSKKTESERGYLPVRPPKAISDRVVSLNLKKVIHGKKKIALNTTCVEIMESGLTIEEEKFKQSLKEA